MSLLECKLVKGCSVLRTKVASADPGCLLRMPVKIENLLAAQDYAISSTSLYLLHRLRRIATVMARKVASPDELEARAEANGYQRGAHREEDSRRDGNKHEDKTKKNQDATLGHYIM